MSNNCSLIVLIVGFIFFLGGIGSLFFGLDLEMGDKTTPEGKAMGASRDFFIGFGTALIIISLVLIIICLLITSRKRKI